MGLRTRLFSILWFLKIPVSPLPIAASLLSSPLPSFSPLPSPTPPPLLLYPLVSLLFLLLFHLLFLLLLLHSSSHCPFFFSVFLLFVNLPTIAASVPHPPHSLLLVSSSFLYSYFSSSLLFITFIHEY